MSIITERLEALNAGTITLDHGSHNEFEEGHCSMEVVSWLAGEGFTDAPACASPVLTRYTIRLNDRWDTEQRQTLAPFLPRMVGTGNDGLDEERQRIATRYLVTNLLGPWLRLAGMHDDADLLASFVALPVTELIVKLRGIRERAWEKRSASRAELRNKIEAKVRERFAEQGKPVAAAVAVAVAAAVAVAVAVAAADADAHAAAAAAAAAVAAAPYDTWGTSYSAAYTAARKYYNEHPEIFAHITELGAKQAPLALELLEAMIKPVAE